MQHLYCFSCMLSLYKPCSTIPHITQIAKDDVLNLCICDAMKYSKRALQMDDVHNTCKVQQFTTRAVNYNITTLLLDKIIICPLLLSFASAGVLNLSSPSRLPSIVVTIVPSSLNTTTLLVPELHTNK